MKDKKTFEILFLQKIPYLTNGLFALFLVSALIFILFYSGMSSDSASPEIKVFYLINTSTVKLLYGSAISTVVFFILYLMAKHKKKGLIVFTDDSIELLFRQEKFIYPFSSMRRVYCNDSEDKDGEPNKKFTMTIETWKNKKLFVRLRNTEDIKEFTDKLLSYDNLKIEYHYSRWTAMN